MDVELPALAVVDGSVGCGRIGEEQEIVCAVKVSPAMTGDP